MRSPSGKFSFRNVAILALVAGSMLIVAPAQAHAAPRLTQAQAQFMYDTTVRMFYALSAAQQAKFRAGYLKLSNLKMFKEWGLVFR